MFLATHGVIRNNSATSTCPYAVIGSSILSGVFSTNSSFAPFYGLYGYSINASLYSTSNLGSSTKQITGVQIYQQSFTLPYTVNAQEIWMGQVSNSTFPTTTPAVNFSDLTFTSPLVKVKGPFNFSVTNGSWVTLTFDTPYCYDNTNNLLFVWKNYDGSWASGYGTAQCANVVSKGMYKGADGAFPTGNGTRNNFPLLVYFNY
jgi:hypothetical protein